MCLVGVNSGVSPGEWCAPPPEQEELEDGLVGSDCDSKLESVDIDISRCLGSANSPSGLSGLSSSPRAFPIAAAARNAITKMFSGEGPSRSASSELCVEGRYSRNSE